MRLLPPHIDTRYFMNKKVMRVPPVTFVALSCALAFPLQAQNPVGTNANHVDRNSTASHPIDFKRTGIVSFSLLIPQVCS